MHPHVPVIIVCWNSGEYLPRCLSGLSTQTYRDFEVILIDNGSTDESTLRLLENSSNMNLHIERFETNRGFAVANNIGARLARGRWLALLNSDAFPQPDWLAHLIKTTENHPEFSFFASRQLQANRLDLLDGAGDTYHLSGFAWRQYFGYPADKFGLVSREVFSACAAAALYSRKAFLQVGGFDEDFFSYYEDVDLSFRLRLQGFRCLYVPDACAHHGGRVAWRWVDGDDDIIAGGEGAVVGSQAQGVNAVGREGGGGVHRVGVARGDRARSADLAPGGGDGSGRVGQAIVADRAVQAGVAGQGDGLVR